MIGSEPIATLVYKSMMTSSKWLDFSYFELFSCTFHRSSNFLRRLKEIFDVIDSELIVTPGSKNI